MQKYIHQLLRDIAAAAIHSDELPDDGPDPGSFEAHIWKVERYLHETPDITLAQHTGLKKVQFPGDELLTDEQCATLAEALKKNLLHLWRQAHHPQGITCPGALPDSGGSSG